MTEYIIMRAKLLLAGALLLSSIQWDRINTNRLLGLVECHWQYGPAACRDWHKSYKSYPLDK